MFLAIKKNFVIHICWLFFSISYQTSSLFSHQIDAIKKSENRFAEFGVKYSTCHETVGTLIEKDSLLTPYAYELEKAFSYLEEKTLKYTIYPSFNEIVRSGEDQNLLRVESLPALEAVVIYLPENNSFFIGQGHHKVVTKALFIRNSTVFISAHCMTDESAKTEIALLSQIGEKDGIVPYLGSIERNKGKKFSLFYLYCNRGSLSLRSCSHNLFFSPNTKIRIARDLALGVQSLHRKGYIHFDIHPGNCFILEKSSGEISAFLGDFGHSFLAKRGGGKSWYITRRRTPPESLQIDIKDIDRYKTDIYALGTVFYKLMWREFHPWRDFLPAIKMHLYGASERKKIYRQIVDSYGRGIRIQVLDPIGGRSKKDQLPEERFARLTYRLLHYNPKKRPSISAIVQELDAILKIDSRGLSSSEI